VHLCVLLVVIAIAQAYLDTVDFDHTTCAASSAFGHGVYCCNGKCADDTQLLAPGLCHDVGDACADTGNAPSCGTNQVLHLDGEQFSVVTGGNCYLPALNACSWSSTLYSWSCCSCPAGYTSNQDSGCSGQANTFYHCVKCTAANEFLSSDKKACVQSQGLSCDIVSNNLVHKAFNVRHID
jgi:hypothetical protein